MHEITAEVLERLLLSTKGTLPGTLLNLSFYII